MLNTEIKTRKRQNIKKQINIRTQGGDKTNEKQKSGVGQDNRNEKGRTYT